MAAVTAASAAASAALGWDAVNHDTYWLYVVTEAALPLVETKAGKEATA